MGDTAISWTDKTWNCLRGCTRVSRGCEECYAEKLALKLNRMAREAGRPEPYAGLVKEVGGEARWTGEVRFIEEHLADPLRWRKPQRIFVNSMSDLFHEMLADEEIDRVFGVMMLAWQHSFQVLTKRPGRMRDYMAAEALGDRWWFAAQKIERESGRGAEALEYHSENPQWPLANVHLGVSVENQATADERIPLLLQTPAAVRWISAEPLLGPIDLRLRALAEETEGEVNTALGWVVVGGESGPKHRPMQIDWLRSIVDQCRAAQVPVWVKQDAGHRPGKQGHIPDELWVQEAAR